MISFLLDHLFESTLFALLLAALTLCFARDRAAVRHGLWFAASVKFLIPFSVIVAAGETLRWESAPAVTFDVAWAVPAVSSAVHLPAMFTELTAPGAAAPVALEQAVPGLSFAVPDLDVLLFALWAAGSLFFLCRWTLQWLRLRAVCEAAVPAQFNLPIPVRFSQALFEPGLVGIFRPVLLLPEGIGQQLSPEQLAFVIKHELAHWRRRDNLTGAVHMAVQLLFWFHPLVWWLGNRLVAERERACDESVLAAGTDPKAYAGSILEVCRFYVRAPFVCTAGVAGANLKDRVARIMENAAFVRLSPAKSALLAGVAAGALLLPIAAGLLTLPAVAAPPAPTPPASTPVVRSPVVARPLAPQSAPARVAQVKASVVQTRDPSPAAEVAPRAAVRTPVPPAAPRAEPQMAAETTAQPPASPSATPAAPPRMEEIVVSGKRIRDFVRTRNFVRDYTAPSSFLDQISRWGAPLCVSTEGLAAGYNAFVAARVKEVAAQIGVPLAKDKDCDVNVSIIFTKHPQALLDYIRTKRPELLGPHYPARRKELATVTHPIQAWYATGTRDQRGRWSIDRYDWNEGIPGEGPPVYYSFGSHLRTGMTSEFASVVIVADIAKIEDREIGAVADYIAMTALARMKTVDKCQQLPSISNTLGNCSADVKAAALSEYDMAYLKALYSTASDAPRGLQESSVGYYMVRILEKQAAEQKAGVK